MSKSPGSFPHRATSFPPPAPAGTTAAGTTNNSGLQPHASLAGPSPSAASHGSKPAGASTSPSHAGGPPTRVTPSSSSGGAPAPAAAAAAAHKNDALPAGIKKKETLKETRFLRFVEVDYERPPDAPGGKPLPGGKWSYVERTTRNASGVDGELWTASAWPLQAPRHERLSRVERVTSDSVGSCHGAGFVWGVFGCARHTSHSGALAPAF